MAVTPKQAELFGELVERKQFPDGTDKAALLTQFSSLSRTAASTWIDKALALPNATPADDEGANTPAPF